MHEYWWPPDEEETETGTYYRIARSVSSIWSGKKWAGQITNDDQQWKLIQILREKYVYPDYLDLVGPPSPDDYVPDMELTVGRMTELLLIGTFEWQGLTIAKHPSVYGYDLWGVPNWTVDQEGWYVAGEPVSNNAFGYYQLFEPFKGLRCHKLADHIAGDGKPLPERHGAIPINGKRYDLRPENLRVINLRGRPMRCKRCGQRVTPEHSRRIKIDGSYRRYCYFCIETMADHQPIAQLW